jgi:hypothetical protein
VLAHSQQVLDLAKVRDFVVNLLQVNWALERRVHLTLECQDGCFFQVQV